MYYKIQKTAKLFLDSGNWVSVHTCIGSSPPDLYEDHIEIFTKEKVMKQDLGNLAGLIVQKALSLNHLLVSLESLACT